MASFSTHITIGTVASVAMAGFIYSLGVAGPIELIALTGVGVIGSILPDIDSDHSRAALIVFNILATVCAGLYFSWFYNQFPLPVLLTLALAVYVFIRYPLKWLFGKFTVHRGIFHSLLAAVLLSLLGVVVASNVFHCNDRLSWLTGLFILASYLVHLTLDELYSVDFSNQRIKRSFGTALKPLCFKRLHNSIISIALAILAFTVTPEFSLTQQQGESRVTATTN